MSVLKIGPHDVEVAFDMEQEDHGVFSDDEGPKITLGPACLDNDCLRYTTLLHEALHALCTYNGTSELFAENEELIVRSLEHGLSALFRDNQEFALNLVTALSIKS